MRIPYWLIKNWCTYRKSHIATLVDLIACLTLHGARAQEHCEVCTITFTAPKDLPVHDAVTSM